MNLRAAKEDQILEQQRKVAKEDQILEQQRNIIAKGQGSKGASDLRATKEHYIFRVYRASWSMH